MFELTINDEYDEDENIFSLKFKNEMIELKVSFYLN